MLIFDELICGVDVGVKVEIYWLIFVLVRWGVVLIVVLLELLEVFGLVDCVLVIGEGELCGDFVN